MTIEDFEVTVGFADAGEVAELIMVGELDLAASAPMLAAAEAALATSSARRVVVDLNGVTFIDSFGVGALVSLYRMGKRDGRSITLRDASPAAAAILRVTAVDHLFIGD